MRLVPFPCTSSCATPHVQLRLKTSNPKIRLYITCFNERIWNRQRSTRLIPKISSSWRAFLEFVQQPNIAAWCFLSCIVVCRMWVHGQIFSGYNSHLQANNFLQVSYSCVMQFRTPGDTLHQKKFAGTGWDKTQRIKRAKAYGLLFSCLAVISVFD